MGIYHSFQFSGMFVGGLAAGVLFGKFGASGVYIFCGIVAFIWLIIATLGPQPRLLVNKIISIDGIPLSQRDQLIDRISTLNGVQGIVTEKTHHTAYLTVDPSTFDEAKFDAVISGLSEHEFEY